VDRTIAAERRGNEPGQIPICLPEGSRTDSTWHSSGGQNPPAGIKACQHKMEYSWNAVISSLGLFSKRRGITMLKAKHIIRQSPLSDAPDVPEGTVGTLDDIDQAAELLVIDFGEPYGHVLCDAGEVS